MLKKPEILILPIITLCACQSAAPLTGKDSPYMPVSESTPLEKSIAYQIDTHRVKLGHKRLNYHNGLAQLARQHSAKLAYAFNKGGKHKLSHDGFSSRMDTIIFDYHLQKAAENVAHQYRTTNEDTKLVKLWVNSNKHKTNMNQTWSHTGVGLVRAKDGALYATQIFALKTDFTF